MQLSETIADKRLHSGETVTIEQQPKVEGPECYRTVITSSYGVAHMRFPRKIQAQTLERAQAIFDDIKPEDTFSSIRERCTAYFE